MPSRPLDKVLDLTVVPGFSSIGYRLRRSGFEPTPDLSGRTVLVTGANSGLGAAACEILAEAGASVHLLVRDRAKGETARAAIAGRTGSDALRVWTCDVSRPGPVREFATAFVAEVPSLQALVNNAGVLPPERTRTPEGTELTFATNVAGPFLLTALLLPALEAGAPARVVNVSSGGMYTARLRGDDLQLEDVEFDGARFYAHTKRCEVVLTELWQERFGDGVGFHSMHPGWADTPGVKDSLPRFYRVMGPILRDARQGADTIAWLCWGDEPVADPGRFWHDREPRPTHRSGKTRESEADRMALWAECERLAGQAVTPSPA